MVVLQAFINISMVLALMPTKGIALPFISQGGSSLLLNLMATGILLNISNYAEKNVRSPVFGLDLLKQWSLGRRTGASGRLPGDYDRESEIRNPQCRTASVVFAGGGTGGHLYIGIALARELRRRNPAGDALFVGTRRGLEARIVPQEGFPCRVHRFCRIEKSGTLGGCAQFLPDSEKPVAGQAVVAQVRTRHCRGCRRLFFRAGGVGGLVAGQAHADRGTQCLSGAGESMARSRGRCRALWRSPTPLGTSARRRSSPGFRCGRNSCSCPRRARRAGELSLLIYGGSQGSRALNAIVCSALPGSEGARPRTPPDAPDRGAGARGSAPGVSGGGSGRATCRPSSRASTSSSAMPT